MEAKKRSLEQISKVVCETVEEITAKLKNIENKHEKDNIISEVCKKHDISEKHIRLIGDFFNNNKKKHPKK